MKRSPAKPGFPAACVSAKNRAEIPAAATGKGDGSAVPEAATERLFAAARAEVGRRVECPAGLKSA